MKDMQCYDRRTPMQELQPTEQPESLSFGVWLIAVMAVLAAFGLVLAWSLYY
jgi:type III secretory pathway component EscS